MEFIKEFDEIIKIWADGDLKSAVFESSTDYIFELAETLALSSKYHFSETKNNNKNFSFIANSSLSGGPHPCSAPECRMKKLDQLVSFASLYADEVYIQNPFEKIYLSGKVNDAARGELISGIFQYAYLKPLINEGIIKYAQNSVSLCDRHNKTIATPLSKKIKDKEERLYSLLHEQLISKCAIYFDIGESCGPFLKIEGPTGFIEHGGMYVYLTDEYEDFYRPLQSKRLPYKLSKNQILSEDLLYLITSPIVRDLSRQEWHSAFNGTSYLCDHSTQIHLASRLNPETYIANSKAFNAALQHSLPVVYGKDIQRIIELRNQEYEAFRVYRDKVHSIIKPIKNWTESELSEAFRDQILPEINLIDKKVNDWKRNAKDSLKEKIIFGSGAVTVGLYAGMLPPDIGQIFAAVGGGSAIVGAAMDYNKIFKEKNEARTNDMYFLWQANK